MSATVHINSPAGCKGAPAGCISSAGPDRPLNPDFALLTLIPPGGAVSTTRKQWKLRRSNDNHPLAGRRRWAWQWSRSAGGTNQGCRRGWDIQLSVISSNCNFMYPAGKVDLESSRGVILSVYEHSLECSPEYSLWNTLYGVYSVCTEYGVDLILDSSLSLTNLLNHSILLHSHWVGPYEDPSPLSGWLWPIMTVQR